MGVQASFFQISRDWGKKSLVEIDNLEEIILEDG